MQFQYRNQSWFLLEIRDLNLLGVSLLLPPRFGLTELKLRVCSMIYDKHIFSLISSFANLLTSSYLVRFFRLTAPAAVLGHLGAISLKNLTKRKEVRKGADQDI